MSWSGGADCLPCWLRPGSCKIRLKICLRARSAQKFVKMCLPGSLPGSTLHSSTVAATRSTPRSHNHDTHPPSPTPRDANHGTVVSTASHHIPAPPSLPLSLSCASRPLRLVGWQEPLEAEMTRGGVQILSKSCQNLPAGIEICLLKMCLSPDQNPGLSQVPSRAPPRVKLEP